MNPEEASYQEFKERFIAAFENNAQTRLEVAHIGTHLAATEEHLTERLAEIASFLKDITIMSTDVQQLQERLETKRKKIEVLETQEIKLERAIALLETHIIEIEAIFNRRLWLVYIETITLILLSIIMLIHIA